MAGSSYRYADMRREDIPKKTNGIDQAYTQVDLKRSELKFGMPHPSIDGLFFFVWDKRKPHPQRWRDIDAIEKERARQVRSRKKQRKQPGYYERRRKQQREARLKDPERYKEYSRRASIIWKESGKRAEYESRPEVRARKNKLQNERYQKNKEQMRAYARADYKKHKQAIRERRQSPKFRLVDSIRQRVYRVVKQRFTPSAKTLELIGCTQDELISWVERQFEEGMTWENYGLHGWHLDHVVPVAMYMDNIEDPDVQRKCFNMKNLKPMWAEDNRRKSSIYRGINYRNPNRRYGT